MSDLDRYLKALVEANGSDLHLKVGQPPVMRIDGDLSTGKKGAKLSSEELDKIAEEIVPERLEVLYESSGGADFAYTGEGLGRFRVNVFKQRGLTGMVFRRVVPVPPVIDSLHLPEAVKRL